ncbi:MAG TPA: hypothetical protein VMW72_17405 [Sedimentisphaerales bacterium]|nr:hypothetical protein [Sedimentisphaerales bacterium]
MNPRPQNPDPFFSSKSQFLDDEEELQPIVQCFSLVSFGMVAISATAAKTVIEAADYARGKPEKAEHNGEQNCHKQKL